MFIRPIVYKGSWPGRWSDPLPPFSTERELPLETTEELEEVHAFVNRAFPSCLVLEGASDTEEALTLCADLKKDPFTAVVPIVVPVLADQADRTSDWLAAGADEVISENQTERERELRLGLVIRRAQRNGTVHPTTRLPGTVQIKRDIGDRLRLEEGFPVCYADLDNFKEFNDRYGYNH
jgi:PleD family two-component response regulator